MAVDPGHIEAVSAWLRAGAGGPQPADRVISTHAAYVFLVGDCAFKLKKAVDLGYLDFSTPARRAMAIDRELEMNRATAPDLYLATHWVTRQADGSLAFDGAGERLERVLRLRRFDPDLVLSNQPQRVRGDFAEDLGRRIADFHGRAPVCGDSDGAATLRFVVESNADHLRALPALAGPLAEQVIAATQAAFDAAAPLLRARAAAGWVRRCHGDLHLGNITVQDGHPLLFDCIEFNDALSRIDVLYDLAFLLMDLTFRGERAGAVRVLNGYLDAAQRQGGDVLGGLAALPFFLSLRAVVRAHVSAQMGQPETGRAYLAAGLAHLSPSAPRLVAIGGVSGSGKSTVARAAAPGLGAEPGAVILRSDEIRKRLWGAAPTDRLPPDAYGPGTSDRVYAVMFDEAGQALRAGRAVVLDAVFLRQDERAAAAAAARECGVGFVGAWLQAPPEVLTRRVGARTGDASDADAGVVAAQLAMDPGRIDWLRLDASKEAQVSAAAILSVSAPA